MKKVFFAIGLMAAMVAVSCNKQLSTEVSEEPEYYEVKLGMSGAITSEISELTKSGDALDQLIGINVWSCPEDDNTNSYSRYAYGLFDVNDITVTLQTGKKYKFDVRSAIDCKEICHYAPNPENTYLGPFSNNSMQAYTLVENEFIYGTNYGFSDGDKPILPLDLYYGDFEGFSPEKGKSVTIDMFRVSYGLKVIAQNLPEGYSIILHNDIFDDIVNNQKDIVLTYSNPMHYDLRTKHSAVNANEETVSFMVNMVDANNKVIATFGTITVKVISNKLTTIKINADINSVDNAFSLEYSDDPFDDSENEDTTYEISGGEPIDTPIEGV